MGARSKHRALHRTLPQPTGAMLGGLLLLQGSWYLPGPPQSCARGRADSGTASHMQNALTMVRIRCRGSSCHAAASAKRSPSAPKDSLQPAWRTMHQGQADLPRSKFAKLFNALSCVHVFKCAYGGPHAPPVAISAGPAPLTLAGS